MTKENETSIKISNKGKAFLKQMQINRIKLDLEPLTYSKSLERISEYFKSNNNYYLEMIKEKDKNVR